MPQTQESAPTPEHRPEGQPDVVSDPKLDDPLDPSADVDQVDEGTSSDWTSEGGATQEGPATKPAAGHEPGA